MADKRNPNEDKKMSINDDYIELLSYVKKKDEYEDIYSYSSNDEDEYEDIFSDSSKEDIYISKGRRKAPEEGGIYISRNKPSYRLQETDEYSEDDVAEVRCRRNEMKKPAGRIHMFREAEEKHEIGGGFGDDLYGLQNGELQSLVFLTKFGEQYGCKGIQSQDSSHIHYAAAISFISQGRRNRPGECNHQGEECRTDAEDCDKCIGIDFL